MPLGLHGVQAPGIPRQSAQQVGEVVSARHRPPLSRRRYLWYSFLLEVRTQGHSAAGRIMSIKNANGPIGYGIRELDQASASPPQVNKYSLVSLTMWGSKRRRCTELQLYHIRCFA